MIFIQLSRAGTRRGSASPARKPRENRASKTINPVRKRDVEIQQQQEEQPEEDDNRDEIIAEQQRIIDELNNELESLKSKDPNV